MSCSHVRVVRHGKRVALHVDTSVYLLSRYSSASREVTEEKEEEEDGVGVNTAVQNTNKLVSPLPSSSVIIAHKRLPIRSDYRRSRQDYYSVGKRPQCGEIEHQRIT